MPTLTKVTPTEASLRVTEAEQATKRLRTERERVRRREHYRAQTQLARSRGVCADCSGPMDDVDLAVKRIRCRACRPGGSKQHQWSDADDAIVRRDYAHTNPSAAAIAARLGVTLGAVKGRVNYLGCSKRTLRKMWTAAEDGKLELWVGEKPLTEIARLLKRTFSSVRVRTTRLGLSARARTDWYTKSETSAILGIAHKTVQAHINAGRLHAEPFFPGAQPGHRGMTPWKVPRKDLRDFIRRYPELLNGRNVDMTQIVEILVGLETQLKKEEVS